MSASDITIWYLSEFDLTDFEIDLATRSGSFKLNFPKIMGLSRHVIIEGKLSSLFPVRCRPCKAFLQIQDMKMAIDFNYELKNFALQINVPESGFKLIHGRPAPGGHLLQLEGLNGAPPGSQLDSIQKAFMNNIHPFLWKQVKI